MRPVVAVVALGVALASVATTLDRTWSLLSGVRHAGAGLTAEERVHAPGDALPLPMDRFDFFRAHLRRDAVYWLQVRQSGFGEFLDLPEAVAALSRFYLLPALLTSDLGRANTVISWDADPGLLPVAYWQKYRAAKQVVFVSRIRRR